jgi:hypothetical protein
VLSKASNLIKAAYRNPAVRNVLTAIAATAAGFVLLNLAFMADALFQHVMDETVRIAAPALRWNWLPAAKHGMFAVLILLVSLLVLRSKLNVFIKATFMILPLATVYVTIGMLLSSRPIIAWLLGALTGVGVLICLCRTKKPWLYFYTLILISVAMLLVSIFDVQI